MDKKIAVVIDADNTQPSKISAVLQEISKYGRIVVKRAYGNWRKDTLKNWETETKQLAIKAVQQFDYVSGKNATDMALVIDTIELLYTNMYDTFVIVSSDSDYTPLAIKLRESGVYVMGVGEKTTPQPFINSCDEFLLLENISIPSTKTKKNTSQAPTDPINEIHNLLKSACTTYQDEEGFTDMGAAGSFIKRAKPDFDSRTYGYRKLTDLLSAFPKRYKVKREQEKGTTIIYYKCLK